MFADSDAANAAMERYASGDTAAFEELYDLVAPRLYGYFRRHLRDAVAAEDLVQATLLRVHEASGTFHRGADVVPWIFTIAKHLLVDRLRVRGREILVDDGAAADAAYAAAADPGATADDPALTRELAECVARVLGRIPDAQRAAFELVRQEGMSHRQAADALGTTVSSVTLRVHRACATIRKALANNEGAR